ncbi:MAG: transposase, partial [Opitutaceae bacterium]|nr:transposase [Opitutaceae bacterium]
KRLAEVISTKKAADWTGFLQSISAHWPGAEKITLVQDNPTTHTAGSVYETLPPAQARALLERFEFVYTPKHGSWLNIAEIEINSRVKQCLDRRIADIEHMRSEVAAWPQQHNAAKLIIRWRFSTDDARIKLHRLYPTFAGGPVLSGGGDRLA